MKKIKAGDLKHPVTRNKIPSEQHNIYLRFGVKKHIKVIVTVFYLHKSHDYLKPGLFLEIVNVIIRIYILDVFRIGNCDMQNLGLRSQTAARYMQKRHYDSKNEKLTDLPVHRDSSFPSEKLRSNS